ncbi:MAG: adenylate kinase [Bacilli bacterium]
MQVVFLGLPGAGKGTQAVGITEEFHIAHIATGDMFREAKAAKTPLGKEVQEYLDKGLLVPDELTIRLVRERLGQADAKHGFLLDGFPRTLPQAQALDGMLAEEGLSLTHVLYLQVSEAELLQRLTGRRVCPDCGASYHGTFHPPRNDGVCDRCGGALIQRADDRPEAVSVRLQENLERTVMLSEFYERRGLLATIDGERSIGRVYDEIRQALRGDHS